ncbi:MAG: putative LPS assembly protein LptD [Bacteroidetes bacterium]|nr:putative LPS assembly protein LptD [Bacteroidota bacterium]
MKGFSQGETKKAVTKDSTKKTVDTIAISKSGLQAEVKYSAKDSIIYAIEEKKVYLYGAAKIHYQDIDMLADYVVINWATNELTAEGRKDSTGKIKGTPVFTEKGQSYKANKMAYNFKSKKGKVMDLHTAEGEGFIIVTKGKYFKEEDSGENIIYARDAKYTTCNLDSPHFYIQAAKLKLIPKDKIITGSAIMYIQDVPMPLLLPFGFFPAKSRRSSGLIIPAYGEDANRGGFFLRNGGYYFGLNDYYDLKLTGDIYANGGWGANATTNYAKMYRFRGSLSLSYSNQIIGLEDVLSTDSRAVQKSQLYNISWSHSQDGKAHPGSSFSASVNAGSSKYQRNNSLDYTKRLESSMNSNISYNKTFIGTPFSLNSALSHSQNTQTGDVSLTLPQVNLNMQRIFPFQTKNSLNNNTWFKKIGFSWNSSFQNTVNAKENKLFVDGKPNDSVIKEMRNGVKHSLPISTNIQILKYFNLSPGFNYNGYLYFRRDIQNWDAANKKIIYTPQRGIFYANDYSTSANLSTVAYGTYRINTGNFMAVRHTVTPNVNFRYTPDFSTTQYNYYNTVQYDTLGHTRKYSYYEKGIYGGPGQGKFGGIDFSLGNVLELKMKSAKDTVTHTKKVKLLDGFNISSSYNFLKDTLKFSNFNISAYTTLFNNINVNANCNIDPYKANNINGQDYNKFILEDKQSLGRITSASLTTSAGLNPAANKKEKEMSKYIDPRIRYFYPGTYVDYTIPWNLSLNYSLNYNSSFSFIDKKNIGAINQTVSMSGAVQLTPYWKIDFRGGYDIKNKSFTAPEVKVYRDLHCWEMRFTWVPFGAFKSYLFTVQIKAPSLHDLKYDKKKDNRTY